MHSIVPTIAVKRIMRTVYHIDVRRWDGAPKWVSSNSRIHMKTNMDCAIVALGPLNMV